MPLLLLPWHVQDIPPPPPPPPEPLLLLFLLPMLTPLRPLDPAGCVDWIRFDAGTPGILGVDRDDVPAVDRPALASTPPAPLLLPPPLVYPRLLLTLPPPLPPPPPPTPPPLLPPAKLRLARLPLASCLAPGLPARAGGTTAVSWFLNTKRHRRGARSASLLLFYKLFV